MEVAWRQGRLPRLTRRAGMKRLWYVPDDDRAPVAPDSPPDRPPPRDPEEIRARLQEMQRELDERQPVHEDEQPAE